MQLHKNPGGVCKCVFVRGGESYALGIGRCFSKHTHHTHTPHAEAQTERAICIAIHCKKMCPPLPTHPLLGYGYGNFSKKNPPKLEQNLRFLVFAMQTALGGEGGGREYILTPLLSNPPPSLNSSSSSSHPHHLTLVFGYCSKRQILIKPGLILYICQANSPVS